MSFFVVETKVVTPFDVALNVYRGNTLFFFSVVSDSFIYFYFTILYWFCCTSTCISHGCTRVPQPEPLSHLPPHTIPLGHPSVPVPSILYHTSNLDWWFASHMIHKVSDMGFPGSSAGEEYACNARDPSLIPGSGSSPVKGIATYSSIIELPLWLRW